MRGERKQAIEWRKVTYYRGRGSGGGTKAWYSKCIFTSPLQPNFFNWQGIGELSEVTMVILIKVWVAFGKIHPLGTVKICAFQC